MVEKQIFPTAKKLVFDLSIYNFCGTHWEKCDIIYFMNNAIVTVVGTDQVGIIAKVSNFLSEKQINIADISQTILSGNFVMMMMVDLSSSTVSIDVLRKEMDELGEKLNVEINIMHERVFSAMHRV